MKKHYVLFFILLVSQIKSQTTNITSFNTRIKANHNFGLTNPLWNDGCLMTYDANPTQIDLNGAAFNFNFTNPGGAGFKGYPSGTVGGFKQGTYYPGNTATSGFPVTIADLNANLRIRWKPYWNNANDLDDKWWATINVIFDNTSSNLEPVQDNRDYDLVIQLKSYEQDDFSDVAQNNSAYWYFARNIDNTLKTYDINLNGTIHRFAVRYKFFNYPIGDPNYDKNDKVHIKFIPYDNTNPIPYLDHSLKNFIDATRDYLAFVNITTAERNLANIKVADPNLWIKSIAGGFEVYTGAFTIGNEYFYTIRDIVSPTASVLTGTLLGNSIKLDWTANTEPDFNKYLIYKSVNNGPFFLINENIVTNTYTDLNTMPNTNYRYYIVNQDRSYNISNNSNTVSLTTPTAITPHQMVQRMGRGTNLGNILSAPFEGNWADPVTEQYIDDLYALRFKTVRIPIRFDNQTTPFTSVTYTAGNGDYIGSPAQYSVNTSYLDRIEQIVDWCLTRNLIPIIDVHGDHWFWESFDSSSSYYRVGNDRLAAIDRFKAIWRDISVRFQNKNENLLFEIMNEPFFSMSASEVADINSQMLAIIRQTNPTRNVIITGGSLNSHQAPMQIPSWLIQSDGYLIGTYHYYQPRAFTASASQTHTDNDWGSAADKSAVDAHFDEVKNWSLANNIPIYMGEYGADNEGGYNYSTSTYGLYGGPDVESRRLYHEYVGNAAKERGFSFSVWDAGEKAGKTVYKASSRNWVKDVRNAVLNKTCTSSGIINNADVECNYDYDWSLILNSGATGYLYNAYENESNNQSVSLKLNVFQTSGTYNHVILTNTDATTNFTPGQTYTFECAAKASTTSQTFRIRIKSIANGVTTFTTSAVQNLNTEYGIYSFNYTVPVNTTSLTFQIICGANVGTYYFDDFKMNDFYQCPTNTTWNGSTWSNGIPNIGVNAIFNGNYSSTGNLNACKVTVNPNFNVSINPNHTLTVANNIQVGNNAVLVVENNGSIIQNSNQSNTGNFQIKRNSAPMIRLDYTTWSSPVNNQQLLAFSPQTLTNRFYSYLYTGFNTATAYLNVNPNSNFLPSNGYYIRVANNWPSSTPTIYNGIFNGTINNGNYTNFTGKGFNLVGNPYPSTIDADTFLAENTNVNALYFWTHTAPAVGSVYPVNNYASYTTLGGTASQAGGETPNGFIQTGQGFFVNTIDSNPIYFKNSQRANATSSTQFFRRNNQVNELIWLDFKNNNEPFNQILIGFTEEGTDQNDPKIDGKIFNNQSNCIYSLIDNDASNFVIQGKKSPLNKNDYFNIGYNALQDGLFTIHLNSTQHIEENQPIYLFDSVLNVYYDLKKGDYTFETEAGRFDERFKIVFKTTNEELTQTTLIYQENSLVTIENQSNKINEIQVFDMLGKLILNLENCNTNSQQFKLIGKQIVIVKVQFDNGATENHKIITK